MQSEWRVISYNMDIVSGSLKTNKWVSLQKLLSMMNYIAIISNDTASFTSTTQVHEKWNGLAGK